jgi:hypothetical protein
MSLKALAAVTTLLIAGAAGVALADTTGEAMMRAFVADLDARPGWSASVLAIRSEDGATIAEGLFVSTGKEGPTVGIGRMALDGLRPRPGGGFIANAMRLEGTALLIDDSTAEAPLVEAEGVALPDLTALATEPDAPLRFVAKLYSALADSEIARLTVPRADLTGRHGTEHGEWELRALNLSLFDLSRGIVQSLDVGPLSGESRNGREEGRWEIASVESRLIGIGAMARLLDPDRYEGGKGDGVWRPYLGSLVYAGLRAEDEEGVLTVDRVAVGNVDLRQPETPFAPSLEQLAGDGDLSGEEAVALVRAFLPGLVQSFRVGEVRLEGLVFEERDEADPPAGARLDRFMVTGISAEGIDSIGLRGLDVRGADAALALARFDLTGLVFPELEAFLTLAELGEKADAAAIQERMGELVAGLVPKIGRVELDGLALEADGMGPITVDHYLAEVGAYVGAFPVTSHMALTGFTIPAPVLQADEEAAELFGALGIDSLTFDLSGESLWTDDEGRYEAELSLAARNLASVRLTADILGVTESWLRRYVALPTTQAGQALSVLSELQLSGLSLAVSDQTLVDRVLGVLAEQQDTDVDAYRSELLAAVPFFLTMLVSDPIWRAEISDSLRAFLQGGRRLTLVVEPPRPRAIADIVATALAQPQTLPTLLGGSLRIDD